MPDTPVGDEAAGDPDERTAPGRRVPRGPRPAPPGPGAPPPGGDLPGLPSTSGEPAGRQAGDDPAPADDGVETAEESRSRRPSSRNLPAAIGVGLVMGALLVGSLFVRREAFVVLTAVTVLVALWELANAFRARRVRVPLVPTMLGSVGMLVSAYVAGLDALFVSFALTCTAILWWRVFEGGEPIRDVTAGFFTAVYVPYLAGFAILMLAEPDGPFRVMAFVIVTVASDVGGYLFGSLWGRRLLAPTVSPSKTWEGVLGSVVLAATAGGFSVALLLDGPWQWGLVLGAAVAVAATIGDLSESLLKRDLGIKDMGSLLPGHGGIMDRLDSLLPAAPVAYVVLTALVA